MHKSFAVFSGPVSVIEYTQHRQLDYIYIHNMKLGIFVMVAEETNQVSHNVYEQIVLMYEVAY